ncbi:MAG: hypothetical protein U0263_38155 [Polyangiaceae bacterium]
MAYWLLTGKYYRQTANQDDTTGDGADEGGVPTARACNRASGEAEAFAPERSTSGSVAASAEMEQRFPDAAAAWAGLESVLSSATPKGSTMPMVAPTARTEPMTTAPMGAVTAAALACIEPAPAPVSVSPRGA